MKFRKLYFADLVTFVSTNLYSSKNNNLEQNGRPQILHGMVIESCLQYKKHIVILYEKKLINRYGKIWRILQNNKGPLPYKRII